jgi:hypothetical protein
VPHPKLQKLATTITARFEDDIDRIGKDLLSKTVQVWDFDDYQITQELVEDIAADAQYRLDLAGDSATWQAFQLGRLDQVVTNGDLIGWVLDSAAQNCDTCIQYASMSPYTIDTLPGIPGEADTECDGSCRCNLIPAT